MDGDGQRLDERGFVVGHGIGNDVDLRGIDREIFAGRAGGLEAHDLQLGAEVIFAVRAGIALPAGDLRLEHDLLADLRPLTALPTLTIWPETSWPWVTGYLVYGCLPW